MPNYNQRQRQPIDYANIYFGFIVWRAIGRVAGKILGGIVIFFYVIAALIWPDQAPTVFADLIVGSIIALILAAVYFFCVAIYRLFVPKTRETKNAQLIRLGIVPNPPEGTNWFRPDGSKIEWNPTTQTWSLYH